MSPVHNLTFYFYEFHVNIILPLTSRSGKCSVTSGWNFSSPLDKNYVTLCQGLTGKNGVFTGEGLCVIRFVKTGSVTSVWRVSFIKLHKGPTTSSQLAIEKHWLAANFPLDIRQFLRSFGSLPLGASKDVKINVMCTSQKTCQVKQDFPHYFVWNPCA